MGIKNKNVVVINNEIMPYRISLFNSLARLAPFNLLVIYCARRSPERTWNLDSFTLDYNHKILRHFLFTLPKNNYDERRYIWVNPTLFFNLVKAKPDVVVGYEYSLPAITALLYARLFRKKFITWTEMTAHAGRNLTYGQKLTRKIIIKASDGFLGTSNAACADLEQRGASPAKIHLGAQPVHTEWFAQTSEKFRQARTDNRPTIIYTGFLNHRKGVIFLLEAFRKVLNEVPDALLKLVGVGEMEETLKATASDLAYKSQVEFLGFVEPSNMPHIYATGDIFVLPSLEDTFGVVAVEALASGLTLVCSKYAGFASHLEHEKNALIIDPLDVDTLASHLVRLLKYPAVREQLNQEAQQIIPLFHPDNVASQFEQAIFQQ